MATIKGTNGRDSLIGTALADVIYGYNGDDEIAGGAGPDRLFGGNGDDELHGEDSNDRLFGAAGNDTLNGGGGSDVLNGGSGYDTMVGGTGNDIYVVDRPGDVVIEQPGEGIDTVRSSVSWTLGDNFERIQLIGSANVSATGNEVSNVVRGNVGSNLLTGEGGDDQIFGGGGNDTLDGGAGRDMLVGGPGADAFVYDDGDFASTSIAGADRIVDFRQVQGDLIDLELVDADTLTDGDQSFDFIGTDGFNNVAGELRYEVLSGNTYVLGDTNGDGVADFAIRLDGALAIQLNDFVL